MPKEHEDDTLDLEIKETPVIEEKLNDKPSQEDMALQKDMSEKALRMEQDERKMSKEEREAERKMELEKAKQRARLVESTIKQRNENKRFQAELDVKKETGKGI